MNDNNPKPIDLSATHDRHVMPSGAIDWRPRKRPWMKPTYVRTPVRPAERYSLFRPWSTPAVIEPEVGRDD